jgi:hypothetical protein
MIRRLPLASFAITGLFLAAQAAHAHPQGYEGYQVVRIQVRDRQELATLKALDAASREFEVWWEAEGLGVIEVRLPSAQRPALDASGLQYEVSIQDLQAWYDTAFGVVPGGGFFDSYHSYDEHVDFMNMLVASYPDLATMVDLGPSVQGRALWAIRITGPGTEKPGALYHGAQHGNEIMGTAVIAYIAQYLLTNYGVDPDVTAVVDDVEWFLLPIMNPDGYVAGSRFNARVVDLNRNWDGPGAGEGAMGGPFPFSEPETAAIRDFLNAHPNIRGYDDFHTYGRMLMWPWCHTADLCEDHPTFDAVAMEMVWRIYDVHGHYYDPGPVYTTIYPVSGGSVNYVYGVKGAWALTFELGYSHNMPPSEILPVSEEITPAMVYFSEWIADCNENDIPDADDIANGTSEDCNENQTPDECEPQPDFDGDGDVDVCDEDIDDDGVLNEADVCEFTPLGLPVGPDGRPNCDTSGDCYADLIDFQRLRQCLLGSGPGTGAPSQTCLEPFDIDGDADVDLADFARFQNAFNPNGGLGVCGPGRGDCLVPHDTPGCYYIPCCVEVCADDPYCCSWEWDEYCVSTAEDLCGL